MTDASLEQDDGTTALKPRRVLRTLLKGLLALILLLVVIAGVTIGPLLFERNDYEHIVSIERRADYRSPALMQAAWGLPVARQYAARFEYQDNPSFCGPTSIANLLNSVGRPSNQHLAINGTPHEPWFGVLIGGMTMDELADLLRRRSDLRVTMVRDLSLPAFRTLMATANDPGRRMIVNFHRGPMFGRGHGHFSPILGYLADRDLVLVGDVNADFRPYLTPVERLWQATDTIDTETGKERGIILAEVVPAG